MNTKYHKLHCTKTVDWQILVAFHCNEHFNALRIASLKVSMICGWELIIRFLPFEEVACVLFEDVLFAGEQRCWAATSG